MCVRWLHVISVRDSVFALIEPKVSYKAKNPGIQRICHLYPLHNHSNRFHHQKVPNLSGWLPFGVQALARNCRRQQPELLPPTLLL